MVTKGNSRHGHGYSYEVAGKGYNLQNWSSPIFLIVTCRSDGKKKMLTALFKPHDLSLLKPSMSVHCAVESVHDMLVEVRLSIPSSCCTISFRTW